MKQIRPALILFALLTLICGVVYPLLVTGLASMVFPVEAEGSLLVIEDRIVGSRLVGQAFSGAGAFWSRPSATAPHAYHAGASAGSNLGPSNPALAEAVAARFPGRIVLGADQVLDCDGTVFHKPADAEAARAQLVWAEKNRNQQKALLDKAFISQSAFDNIQSNHDVAAAKLRAADARKLRADYEKRYEAQFGLRIADVPVEFLAWTVGVSTRPPEIGGHISHGVKSSSTTMPPASTRSTTASTPTAAGSPESRKSSE